MRKKKLPYKKRKSYKCRVIDAYGPECGSGKGKISLAVCFGTKPEFDPIGKW